MDVFPNQRFDDAAAYAEAYFEQVQAAQRSVAPEALRAAATLLAQTVAAGGTVLACGNGGSAAISNHLLCDFLKGMRTGSTLQPRVISLSSSPELMTAVANDFDFAEIFAFQIEAMARPGDLLIATSSSGRSPNIVRAIVAGRAKGMRIVAMTGFDGGRAKLDADVALHVRSDNYGVVEDVHQSLMHILAQYLRHANLTEPADLGRIRF